MGAQSLKKTEQASEIKYLEYVEHSFRHNELVSELWRRGDIGKYYLYNHQQPLYQLLRETERDIILPNISRRFGKTTVCLTYCFEEAIKKKQDIRYATAFREDVQEFLRPIADLLRETMPADVRPEYVESKRSYYFPNGSRIKLVGLDKNPNGIRGNAVDILVIDEAAFVDKLEYIYKSIIVPATANRMFKIIFPSTPPLKADHFWVRSLMPKAMTRGTYMAFTIDDNDALDDAEKARLLEEVGGPESTEARREFYCEIVRDPELIVIPEYNEKTIVKKLTLPEYYYASTVIDFGGSLDKHGVLLCYWDFARAKLCVYDEVLLKKNTRSGIIIKNAKRIERGVKWFTDGGKPSRIGDLPEQLRIDLMAEGFYLAQPQKEKGSVQANVNGVRIAMQRGQIEIDPRCKMLMKTLEFGAWKENKEDWERTDELGHLDLLAALLYAYRHINKDNPYPSYYGRSQDQDEAAEREDTIMDDGDDDDEINILEGF